MTKLLTVIEDDDFALIRDTLYKYQVVVFKNQSGLSPKAQYELTRRFDPSAQGYGHGKTLDAKRSILHPDLKTVPHQPEVQIIGNGFVPEYEGLKNIKLVPPSSQEVSQARHQRRRRFGLHPILPLAYRCCAL